LLRVSVLIDDNSDMGNSVRRKKTHIVIFGLLFLFSLSSRVAAEENAVVIRGTASMLHLCQQLISLYQGEVPQASVGVNVADSVQSLASGRNSIWQSVRSLDRSQKQTLETKFGSEPHEIPIAIEGVVVILNPKNPVTDLSIAQLRSIYLGKTTNWKDLGGPDLSIHLFSTEAVVGGSLFFADLVLHGEDIDTTMRGFTNARETEMAVASDLSGIGLIPIPAGKDVKYPRIRRDAESSGVEATIENIRTLRYPLSSQVHWVIAGQHPEAVTQFVRFTLSQKGQLAAEAAGYYPLNPADRTMAIARVLPASNLSH